MGGWVGGWVKEPLDHLHLSFIQSAQTTHPTPHQTYLLTKAAFPDVGAAQEGNFGVGGGVNGGQGKAQRGRGMVEGRGGEEAAGLGLEARGREEGSRPGFFIRAVEEALEGVDGRGEGKEGAGPLGGGQVSACG